jgi:hypothetical protein
MPTILIRTLRIAPPATISAGPRRRVPVLAARTDAVRGGPVTRFVGDDQTVNWFTAAS